MPLSKKRTFPVYVMGLPEPIGQQLKSFASFLGLSLKVVDAIPEAFDKAQECSILFWYLQGEEIDFKAIQNQIQSLCSKMILIHLSDEQNKKLINQLKAIGFHDSRELDLSLESFEGLIQKWSKTLDELFGPPNIAQSEILDRDLLKSRLEIEKDLLEQLVEIYFREFPILLSTFQTAVKEKTYDQIDALGHRLKGMAANLGAKRISQIANSFEETARRNTWEELPHLLERLEILGKETDLEYRELLKDPRKYLFRI